MSKDFLKFGDIEIEKQKAHYSESSVSINYVDIEKLLISDKFSYGKKKFLSISSATEMKEQLHCCLMSGYLKIFDKAKHMSFGIKDNQLLKKCNKIWDKSVNTMQNKLHSEPVLN